MAVFSVSAAPLPSSKELQPPSPSGRVSGAPKQSDTESSQQTPAQNQRGTKEAPLYFKQIETPDDRDRTNEARREHDQQATNEDITNEIAIGALIAGFLQFCALVGTIYVMDRSAKRQLRAYLAVKPTTVFDPGKNLRTRAAFRIQNFGETPAYHVRYLAGLIVLPHPLPQNQPDIFIAKDGEMAPTLTIHKGQHSVCEALFENGVFIAEDFAKAIGPDHRLYMIGIVEYRDAFNFWRKTRFAAFIENDSLKALQATKSPIKAPISLSGQDFDWVFSHAHNDAT